MKTYCDLCEEQKPTTKAGNLDVCAECRRELIPCACCGDLITEDESCEILPGEFYCEDCREIGPNAPCAFELMETDLTY